MAVKTNKALLTKEGFEQLKKELIYREEELRSKLGEILNQMRNQGDLRENDGYSMAVEDFQNNEDKIAEIHDTLDNSEIVKEKSKDKVDLGSEVTIECEGHKLRTYSIVGEDEANPLEGKISYKSPIGESLMDKKKGSEVTISTPQGSTKCKIIEIK